MALVKHTYLQCSTYFLGCQAKDACFVSFYLYLITQGVYIFQLLYHSIIVFSAIVTGRLCLNFVDTSGRGLGMLLKEL